MSSLFPQAVDRADDALVSISPGRVLGLQQPDGHFLDHLARDLAAGLFRLPGAENAVLGHRGVAAVTAGIAPTPARFLPRLEELQQVTDFVRIRAGVERGQENDRQARGIDFVFVVDADLGGFDAFDDVLNGLDRFDDPRVFVVGVVLQHHQTDQGLGAHATVRGRVGFQELDRAGDGGLDLRTLGRQRRGGLPAQTDRKKNNQPDCSPCLQQKTRLHRCALIEKRTDGRNQDVVPPRG